MTTIVSAFITNINSRKDINLEKYIECGKLLLQSITPKIIFADEIVYNILNQIEYNYENKLIILYNKNYSYLYKYINELSNFNLNTNNPSKDSLEYMFTMCNKTEWIKEAILLNPFNSKNFVWLDFGIRYIFDGSDAEFVCKLDILHTKIYNKIRIGNIWNLNANYNVNIYKNICWYFAGGIFGGNTENLLKFAELMKYKCEYIMSNYKLIMWEVNIWYILYLENEDLFYPYKCDHNNSLIDNY